MKKLLIIFTVIVLSVPSVRGQVLLTIIFGDKLNSPTTEFGLNAGIGISSLSGIEGSTPTTNLALGTFFTWKFHNRFQFQPELYFSLKGGAEKLPPFAISDPRVNLPIDEMNVIRKSNYLSLPLLIKIRTVNQFRFIAGPQFSFMTSTNDYMYYEVDSSKDLMARSKDKSGMNRFDFGLSAGLGYKLGKGNGVSIEAKYYLGFLDTTKSTDINAKNRMIIIQAGIPIRGFAKENNK